MAKNISKGDLRKQDFLVLKQSRDDTVTNVVAPNGLQIGLADERFRNPLTIKGSTIGEGGLTGSLTQLVDGTPYLLAGANILLTTGSTGQVTVATSLGDIAVRRTRFDTTVTSGLIAAETTVPLTNSNMNIVGVHDTDDFIDIFVNGKLLRSGTLAEVQSGIRDYTVDGIYASKQAKFAFDLQLGDVISTAVISSGSANVAAAGDALSLTGNAYNVNVGSSGGIQISSDELAVKTKSGGALSTDSNGLFVDINGQADLGVSVVTSDFVLVYDSDTATIKKVSVGNVQGAGATIDIAGVSNSLTETTLATGDLFAVADVNASNEVKKITAQDFAQFLAAGTNGGISESSGKLAIDLNGMPTTAGVNVASDSIAFIDSGDNATKKDSIADLISGVAGTVTTTGLAASAGTLKVDINAQTDISTGAHSDDTLLIYDDDAGVLKKIKVNNLQSASTAPPGASYVIISNGSDETTLTKERVLTAGDGIDLADGGVGSTATLSVDVTDFIDTAAGLTEDGSNNIQVDLKSSGGLTFDSGEIKVEYGSTAGLAAQGNNTVNILAGDGLKTGGSFNIGASTSTVQLDIKPEDFAGDGLKTVGNDLAIDPTDFAGNGLKVNSDDLVVSIGAGNNVSITTGSDGSFIINSSLPAEGNFTAGNGLDLTGTTFSVDLKLNAGLKIVGTELAVEPVDFAGLGLEDDGSDKLKIKTDTATGAGYAPINVASNGASVRYDNTTIEDSGSGVLAVKNSGITNAKLQNSSLTVTAGDGLKTGGSVSLGSSITLDIDVSDFAGTGLLDEGSENLAIDDAIVATLTGSVFSGHVGITGSLHSTAEISGSILKSPVISGSLTKLEDGSSYLVAGNNIQITTGSSGAVTITGTSSGDMTAVNAGTGLSGGGESGDVTLAIDNSVVATLSGSVFSGHVGITGSLHSTTTVSGSLLKGNSLTGSLTRLNDGTSYLIAGSNVTIASSSNGSVTISASTGSGAGIIGAPEDGSYTDGLFTDFTATTPTGTAVDRFNEILKALAPDPAPDLDDIDCNTSDGTSANLSFGAANDQSSASPAYISSNTAAGFSAVDVNGTFEASTSANNIRKGVYNGSQAITGDLNEDVAINQHNTGVTNHVANAFGFANEGTLQLKVNGSVVHTVDLTLDSSGAGSPGAGSASKLNSNSSGFINLSQTGSAVQSNNVAFSSFQHRTGQYQIGTADQRNGWNFAQVLHVRGSTTVETNYVEWVNDNNSDALSLAGNSISFIGSGSIHLSGVEFFQSGTITYNSRVSNAYKYIYDSSAIVFPDSDASFDKSGLSFSLANQAKPTIDTGNGENHNKVLHLTASAAITADYFLSGTVTAGTTITHPLKSGLTNSGQSTLSPILMYNLSNNSTNLQENFRRENFRLISGSYNTQSDVTTSGNAWNSSVYMTASNGGHSNGLQFFNEKLLSPLNTINNGNFAAFSNGPAENPNYSGVTGTRTFYRYFRNETSATQNDLFLNLYGSGTIVTHGTALDTTKISVLIKLPGKTGWMDVAGTFVLDAVADNDGASAVTTVISKDLVLGTGSPSQAAPNYVNFGNVQILDDEYVVIAIKADESWTGNVSKIDVAFGAGTGTLTAVPDLDDIDVDQDGTDANLSFGSTKAISGYASPSSAAGFTAAGLNDLYQTATNNNNLRAAIFTGTTTIEGDLNEDVSSPGNDFVANAFSDANSGSLKLEVNNVVIHTVEITGSNSLVGAGNPGAGSGTSLNGDGSGFISLSTWAPGLFDNGVPRFSEIQRTAKYRIVAASQRTGWNYARVIHTVGGSDRETNYVEWINDPDGNALASAGNGLTIFGDNSHSFISGVKYFNSPSGSILTRVSNVYRNVYSDSDSAISFTSLTNATASKIIQSGSGLSSTKTTSAATDTLQTLNTSTDSQNELLHVSGTINFTQAKSLPGTYTTSHSCAGAMIFDHPLKSNLTTATQTTTNLLVWTPSDTSNANTDEQFTAEQYRLVSGSYTTQNAISGGSNDWNSERSMNDQGSFPEHATGLLIYDTYLIPPKDGGSSGDFRNHDEGGGIESPAGNVNYSSGVLTNSTRDYFRSFKNNTTNDRPSVQVTLYGDAIIVGKTGPNQAALGSNKNIFVEVSVPEKTGLLDLGKPSAGAGNFNEGDGCLSGDLNATITNSGITNTATFNGVTADGTVSTSGEYIIVRITASKNWTGYLDRLSISWS